MQRLLKRHPHSRCFAAASIEVGIACPRSDRLILSYIVTGKMGDILMPPVALAARSDELWQHTCFEAFVRASSAAEYYELNFSPSTQWAAYRFASYRTGMAVVAEIAAIRIEAQWRTDSYVLQASLELDRLSDLPRSAPWHMGLSAVIEDTSGRKSYWALRHPPGKPDFHHADCFGHEFSPSEQT
jgi:hypothetical protein